MRALGAVARAFGRDDRAEPVAHRVDHRRADAAAGRASGDDRGVDAAPGEPVREVGGEEARRVVLADHPFSRPRLELVDDGGRAGVGDELAQPRRLHVEDAVLAAVGGVDMRREGDRQIEMARKAQQLLGTVDRRLDAAAAEHVGIVERVDEVDDDQGRLIAEPDAVAEALLFVDVEIACHDALPAVVWRSELSRGSPTCRRRTCRDR